MPPPMSERVCLGVGTTSTATPEDCSAAIARFVAADWDVVAIGTMEGKQAVVSPVAVSLGVPLHVWAPEELGKVVVPNPSDRARVETGTPSVAEAAAILCSGGGELALTKAGWRGVTVAAACAPD